MAGSGTTTGGPGGAAANGGSGPGPAASSGSRSPLRFRLLLALVLGAGAVSVATAVPAAIAGGVPALWRLALVAALFVAGDTCLLRIRFGHNHQSFTWSEAAAVVGLVLVPGPWLRLLAPIAVAGAHLAARRPPVKIAFNTLSIATEVLVAGAVLNAVVPAGRPAGDSRLWAGLAVAAFALFVWNGLTVSAAVAFSQGIPLLSVYRKGLLLNTLVWAGNTTAGILLVALSSAPGTLVVFPALVAMLYAVYRSYLGAMNERDTWQVLQTTSRDLLRTEPGEVARVVIERPPALFGAEFVELVVVDGEAGHQAVVYRWNGTGGVHETVGEPLALAGAFWPRVVSEREAFQVVAAEAPGRLREDLEAHGLEACAIAPAAQPARVPGHAPGRLPRGRPPGPARAPGPHHVRQPRRLGAPQHPLDRGAAGPGPPGPPHRPAEPHADAGPAVPRPAPPAAPAGGRGRAVLRPRPLQGGQRLPRAPGW